jgi:hypothetical protein
MWSPRKLDFLFYDFSRIQRKQIEKGKVKTTVTVAKLPSKTAQRVI